MNKKKTSIAAIVRENLDGIEEQIMYGVPHEQLNAMLKEAGYELTLGGFRISLARARLLKKKQIQAKERGDVI